ncbi:hypothetical protein HHI36_022127 [Cryptolaemus montrouzieri]|uniref:Uncharacterized protein n=1 Tax=Cryptolaemus montrouzieri TaxID=559131 RepID=A0ABD2MYS7_9CUCU
MVRSKIPLVLSIIAVLAIQIEAKAMPAMVTLFPLYKEGQNPNIFSDMKTNMEAFMKSLTDPTKGANQNPFALDKFNPPINIFDKNGLAKMGEDIKKFNEKLLNDIRQVSAESIAKWNNVPESEKKKLISYGLLSLQAILTENIPEFAVMLLKCVPIIIDNDLLPQIPGVPSIPKKDMENISALLKLLVPS